MCATVKVEEGSKETTYAMVTETKKTTASGSPISKLVFDYPSSPTPTGSSSSVIIHYMSYLPPVLRWSHPPFGGVSGLSTCKYLICERRPFLLLIYIILTQREWIFRQDMNHLWILRPFCIVTVPSSHQWSYNFTRKANAGKVNSPHGTWYHTCTW